MDRKLVEHLIDLAVQDQAGATRLIAKHPDLLQARYIHGETPLHFCAVEGFVDGVRFLAQAGFPVNAPNEFGETALMDAVRLGRDEIVKVLLQCGADPNVSSPTRDPPLDEAVVAGNVSIVEALLDAGARPDYVTNFGLNVWDAVSRSKRRQSVEKALRARGLREP